jgi:hypothetical protein
MPYGFYQFVRFVSMISFAYLFYVNYNNKNRTEAITYFVLTILFQPLIKISLGREIWNIVDVLVAIFLVLSLFIKNNSINNKDEK